MCVLVWHDVCAAKALVCGILCVREVDLYCRLFLKCNRLQLARGDGWGACVWKGGVGRGFEVEGLRGCLT